MHAGCGCCPAGFRRALVAWGWEDHADHQQVAAWIASLRKSARKSVLTSAIPELGFVRVSVQRAAGRVIPEMASQVQDSMIQALGTKHAFIPDDQRAIYPWPQWCQGVGRTTEAHLLALAYSQGAVLATLDRSIPEAFLIP